MTNQPAVVLALVLMLAGCGSGTPIDDTQNPAPPGHSLTGTKWLLIEVEGQPAIGADGPRAAQLVFDAESHGFNGIGGVNQIFGSYTRNGRELTFGPVASTLMAGPEPLMKQEQAVNRALAATHSFAIDNDVLTLYDETDEPVAQFRGTPIED